MPKKNWNRWWLYWTIISCKILRYIYVNHIHLKYNINFYLNEKKILGLRPCLVIFNLRKFHRMNLCFCYVIKWPESKSQIKLKTNCRNPWQGQFFALKNLIIYIEWYLCSVLSWHKHWKYSDTQRTIFYYNA